LHHKNNQNETKSFEYKLVVALTEFQFVSKLPVYIHQKNENIEGLSELTTGLFCY